MAATTAPISIPSIFNTLSSAPRTRDHHAAARLLARVDPKVFLSNLQMAAMHHSPQAITALKADMHELADIFHKLSRAGHDVSAAQRDFKMLELYVSQLASTQKQRSPPQAPVYPHSSGAAKEKSSSRSSQSYHGGGDPRSISLTSSQSHERSRNHSSSIATEKTPRHHHHPLPLPSKSASQAPAQSKGFAPGSAASTSSSRSSSSIVSPMPSRLSKPRRHSAPASVPAKRVHWASHATLYTYTAEEPAVVPPPRPSCVPRASSQ